MDQTPNEIDYEWGLAGPDGAWFTLKPIRGKHTNEDVRMGKIYIRRDHDVVPGGLRVEWQEVNKTK